MLIAPLFARAATIVVSDLDGTYNEQQAASTIGWEGDRPASPAFPFSFPEGESYYVSQTKVAAYHTGQGTNSYRVEVYSGVSKPEVLLVGSRPRPLPVGDNPSHAPTTDFGYIGTTLLLGGGNYWVSLVNMGDGSGAWAQSDTLRGPRAIGSPSGNWQIIDSNSFIGAFELLGFSPVPEPSAVPTFVIATCLMAGVVRFRWGMSSE